VSLDDYRDSEPSPYCGRLDEHEPHKWGVSTARQYECPGAPIITRAEREAVEKSLRAARKEEQ